MIANLLFLAFVAVCSTFIGMKEHRYFQIRGVVIVELMMSIRINSDSELRTDWNRYSI